MLNNFWWVDFQFSHPDRLRRTENTKNNTWCAGTVVHRWTKLYSRHPNAATEIDIIAYITVLITCVSKHIRRQTTVVYAEGSHNPLFKCVSRSLKVIRSYSWRNASIRPTKLPLWSLYITSRLCSGSEISRSFRNFGWLWTTTSRKR